MIGIDTNVLVRFFADDDAEQGAAARRLLNQDLNPGRPGFVSLVTLTELAWVLRSRYSASRDDVISAIETLLVAPQLKVQDDDAVWLALDHCDEPGIAVADALIAALGRHHGCTHTMTFDRRAARIDGMALLDNDA